MAVAAGGIAAISVIMAFSLPLDQSSPDLRINLDKVARTAILLFLFGTAAFAMGYHFRFSR
jgi:hypothetical protein